MKPNVVSKKVKTLLPQAPAPGKVRVWARAKAFKDGVASTLPGALVGASGLAVFDPASTIVQVENIHVLGYTPGSAKAGGWRIAIVDGVRGGTLILTGRLLPDKFGKKGTVLSGRLVGYVTSATGVFSDANLTVGNSFTGKLSGGGRKYVIDVIPP